MKLYESEVVELKEIYISDLKKEIVAFANTNGGTIYIGVRDTFTRPIADHMLKNYDGVLKIENEVGNKQLYDPRAYLKLAEKSMSKRIVEACEVLCSEGKTLCI